MYSAACLATSALAKMLQKITELLNFKIAFLALLKAFDSPVAVGLDWICSFLDIGSSALINDIIY